MSSVNCHQDFPKLIGNGFKKWPFRTKLSHSNQISCPPSPSLLLCQKYEQIFNPRSMEHIVFMSIINPNYQTKKLLSTIEAVIMFLCWSLLPSNISLLQWTAVAFLPCIHSHNDGVFPRSNFVIQHLELTKS